jgi:pentatricopeptide repeat protein
MDPVSASDPQRLAEAVRAACIAAALEAHEQAGISGLCQEGRWEVAIEAVRSLDLASVLANAR